MRVIVVANTFPTHDHPYTGTDVDLQIRSLRSRGLEVDMVPVDRLGTGMRVYRGLGDDVGRHAARTRADLVHVSYGGVMAYNVARAVTRTPVIVTFRGTDLLGGGAGPAAARVRALTGVVASRRAAHLAAGIVVVSPNLRAALPRTVVAPVSTIPFGIELERFAPVDREVARRALGWPVSGRYVLFPASPARPEKRYLLARAVMRTFAPGEVALKELAAVPPSEVPLWFNACDVTLLTSTHEGSPNVVKESLACCTPVVSVDVGDVRERIEGIPGCAVVASDPHALASAVRIALETPRSDAGRLSLAEFDVDVVAERVIDVYESVLERSEAVALLN